MKTTVFIKKYEGKTLADDGAYVSKEFNNFQNAMKREVKRMAEEIGAVLVSFNKGHYDMSWFVERNGKYVYGNYSVIGNRTHVNLLDNVCYARIAAHSKDYIGGHNNRCSFAEMQETMDRLLRA
jgi:hypothetical protein